jgi:F-type H+-transporting ATPase subunit delta
MSELRVAARYAKSLIDLSGEQKNTDAVLNDMQAFTQTYAQHKQLQTLLRSPVITGDKKLAVLKKVFGNFNKLTLAFFDIIIRKKREFYLNAIAEGFIQQYNDLNKVLAATVKTAVEIDEKTQKEIKGFIEKATGKNVELKNTVDASLIGGLVIQMEDKLYDASVAGKLRKAKQELLNTYISK